MYGFYLSFKPIRRKNSPKSEVYETFPHFALLIKPKIFNISTHNKNFFMATFYTQNLLKFFVFKLFKGTFINSMRSNLI